MILHPAYLCIHKIFSMKKLILPVFGLLGLIAFACKNADKKSGSHSHSGTEPKTQTDSLLKDIDEGHVVGMSKIGKLHNTKKAVQRVIDSIGKLSASAKQSFAPYVKDLNSVIKDLDYADFAMEKWMTEYVDDSLKDIAEKHINYLEDEKMKVDKMKEAILSSLHKADSLLKVKL
jgi:hypothetical protein